jgi:hypothetical protein
MKDTLDTESKEMKTPIPCETEHDFTLVLDLPSVLTSEMEDALFEAGCDDCTISVYSGRLVLTFTRVAGSMDQAITSAIRDVRAANIGATVLRVDDCNLVTQSEIARKIARTRQQVHQYITGERGSGGFPPPACHITDKAPLWHWCEVAHWLYTQGIIKENAWKDAQAIDAINTILDYCNQKSGNPELFNRLFDELVECSV